MFCAEKFLPKLSSGFNFLAFYSGQSLQRLWVNGRVRQRASQRVLSGSCMLPMWPCNSCGQFMSQDHLWTMLSPLFALPQCCCKLGLCQGHKETVNAIIHNK